MATDLGAAARADIARMRERAGEALTALDAEPATADEGIRAWAEKARSRAGALIQAAREPVTIGVVGGFSAGKSLLLGTLLGRPGLLPVEHRATTGNVTRLTLRQSAADGPTTVVGASVSFLTAAEVTECVDYMLTELIDEIRKNAPRQDASPLVGYDPTSAVGWGLFERWAKPLYEVERPARYHSMISELLRMRDACASGRAFLGRDIPEDPRKLREALDLKVPDEPTTAFPETRVVHGLDPDRGLDAETLEATFPIVRRVNLVVEVPARVWPLATVSGDNEVVLLDFPGLGATTSGLRDRFLSRRELADVTTILITMDGLSPQADIVREFLSMLEHHRRTDHELANCVLTTVNRFDLLTPPALLAGPAATGPTTDPTDAGPDATGPLQPAEVLAASDDLRAAWNVASELVGGRDHRIVLTSSVAAIGRYRLELDGLSERERQLIPAMIGTAGKRAAVWSPAAERMAAAAPAGRLATLLDGFADNGGMTVLRAMIERHVAEHGADLRARRMHADEAEMITALRGVCRVVRATAGGSGDGAQQSAEDEALANLINRLERAVEELGAAAEVFRDPSGTVLADGRTTLVEAVQADAVAQVFDWRQWRELRSRTRAGIVEVAQRPSGSFGSSFSGLGITPRRPSGDTTEPFLAEFLATTARVIRSGEDLLLDLVEAWGLDRDTELTEVRSVLRDEITMTALADRLHASDPELAENQLMLVRQLGDLSWLMEPLRAKVEQDRPQWAPTADRFPLRPGQSLPWHADRVSAADDDAESRHDRHQINVIRMRRELANAVGRSATVALGRTVTDLADLVDEAAAILRDNLPTAADIRRRRPSRSVPDAPAPAAESPVCALLSRWEVS